MTQRLTVEMTAVTAAVASTDSLWYMSGTDWSYCFFWCHTHDLCSTRLEPSTSWHLYPSTLTRCSCLHHLFHVLILTAHGVCDPKQKSCSQDNYYTFTNSSTQSDLQPVILLMALLSITLNLNSAWIIFFLQDNCLMDMMTSTSAPFWMRTGWVNFHTGL